MRELVKPVIVCAYCKASFDSTERCNLHVELEKHCRRRRRRLTRRVRKQRTRADDDSRPGVNHVEEQAFNVVEGDPVEEESETFQGEQGIQKRETCQFCLFTKTNCKCKAEQEEQKEVTSNSKMKVDKRSKNQPIKIKTNLAKKQHATSSNVDTVEEPEVIESVNQSSFNLVCPQNREGFWVVFDKCLLDTVNAGLCFSFTHDGQVSHDFLLLPCLRAMY